MGRLEWVRWVVGTGSRMIGVRLPMITLVILLCVPFVVALDRGYVTGPLEQLGLIAAGGLVGMGVSRLRRWAEDNLSWYDRLRTAEPNATGPEDGSAPTDLEQ